MIGQQETAAGSTLRRMVLALAVAAVMAAMVMALAVPAFAAPGAPGNPNSLAATSGLPNDGHNFGHCQSSGGTLGEPAEVANPSNGNPPHSQSDGFGILCPKQ